MGEWSEEARERAQERRKIRISEAADALVEVLEEEGATSPGNVIPKATLFRTVAQQARANRKRDGAWNIPTVENTPVRDVTVRFVANNWSEIVQWCADNASFVVYETGRSGGNRLGTRAEYTAQQRHLKSVADGTVDRYNERVEAINKHGGDERFLDRPQLTDGNK